VGSWLVSMRERIMSSIIIPSSPEACLIWRNQGVQPRIRAALAEWSKELLDNIISTITLGYIAKGSDWGEEQQARLVQITNAWDVFAPFQSRMAPPPLLLPSTTTVAQWERLVWRQQTPHTFCFIFDG
jgi:hypothetical protein